MATGTVKWFNATKGYALPILGDLLSYTVASIFSWMVSPLVFRRIFSPRAVPQRAARVTVGLVQQRARKS